MTLASTLQTRVSACLGVRRHATRVPGKSGRIRLLVDDRVFHPHARHLALEC